MNEPEVGATPSPARDLEKSEHEWDDAGADSRADKPMPHWMTSVANPRNQSAGDFTAMTPVTVFPARRGSVVLRWLPPERLRCLIDLIVVSTHQAGDEGALVMRALPRPTPWVTFRVGAPVFRFDPRQPGSEMLEPGAHVSGYERSWSHMVLPSGQTTTVCARVRPEAAGRLFHLGPNDLDGRGYELSELWGRVAQIAHEKIAASESAEVRVRDLIRLLDSRLASMRGARSALRQATDALAAYGGRNSVSRAARTLGVSTRRLNAVFQDNACVAPKLLARLWRFQRSAQSLNPKGWLEPRELGPDEFSDYSHLSREFVELTGLTPRAYGALKAGDALVHSLRLEPGNAEIEAVARLGLSSRGQSIPSQLHAATG